MNKNHYFMIAAFILFLSPVWGAFCHHCGKPLPDLANFCPACGTASAIAFTPAPAPTATSTIDHKMQDQLVVAPAAKTISPAPATPANTHDNSLSTYDFINQIEQLLTDMSYNSAERQAMILRQQNQDSIHRMQKGFGSFNSYQRKINDLHLRKLKALDSYFTAWRRVESGPDKVQAQAEKDKALFVLGKVNEALDQLLSGGNNLVNLAEVEKLEKRMDKTTANFVVTSSYLLINNQRLNRGEPFWVIDVSGANAQILHMGRSRYPAPVTGFISVYDLEKRSNWRSHPDFFYSSAPPVNVHYDKPATEVKVVVYERKPYYYRHHPWGKNRHKRRYPHRRYEYVVVEPQFW